MDAIYEMLSRSIIKSKQASKMSAGDYEKLNFLQGECKYLLPQSPLADRDTIRSLIFDFSDGILTLLRNNCTTGEKSVIQPLSLKLCEAIVTLVFGETVVVNKERGYKISLDRCEQEISGKFDKVCCFGNHPILSFEDKNPKNDLSKSNLAQAASQVASVYHDIARVCSKVQFSIGFLSNGREWVLITRQVIRKFEYVFRESKIVNTIIQKEGGFVLNIDGIDKVTQFFLHAIATMEISIRELLKIAEKVDPITLQIINEERDEGDSDHHGEGDEGDSDHHGENEINPNDLAGSLETTTLGNSASEIGFVKNNKTSDGVKKSSRSKFDQDEIMRQELQKKLLDAHVKLNNFVFPRSFDFVSNL